MDKGDPTINIGNGQARVSDTGREYQAFTCRRQRQTLEAGNRRKIEPDCSDNVHAGEVVWSG